MRKTIPPVQTGFASQLFVLVFASVVACAGNAQVYKWTDKEGKPVYGDRPPPEVTSSDVKIPVTSFGGSPVFKSFSSPSVRKPDAKAPTELVLYSADWCGICREAKAFFGANSIAYREVNIDKDTTGAAEFKRVYGGGGIPLAVAGEKTIRGFSAESMLYFLKNNGIVSKNSYIEKAGKP